MGGNAAAFGREIPKRAIERVARGASGQEALQALAVGAGFDRGSDQFNLRANCLDRFAIAGIGHAFAAPACARLPDHCDDDDRFGLLPAGNRKFARDRKPFDRDMEVSHVRLIA